MGKRFYCDFCDKSFPYNTINRKKHNEGIQHLTLRQEYYNRFKSFRLQLEDELNKKPCFKHLVFSNCSFQSKCRCSHKGIDDLSVLLKNYESDVKKVDSCQKRTANQVKKEINKHLVEKKMSDYLKEQKKFIFTDIVPKYKLPEQLCKLEYVPLSLVPPTSEDFLNFDLNTWG